MSSTRRPSRRAVRPAGTVGADDAILRSTHPAAPAVEKPSTAKPGGLEAAADRALPIRSLDDSDVGWGESGGGNDERLRRDKPPHW